MAASLALGTIAGIGAFIEQSKTEYLFFYHNVHISIKQNHLRNVIFSEVFL